VSEYLAASPVVARSWCPGCEPSADPLIEILDVHYCDAHTPDRDGAADAIVPSEIILTGSSEAGGEANRIWCDLLHRQLPRERRNRR
jgi:hypothetical protein